MLQIDTDHTIPDWFNFHRDLCTDWVRANQQPIGGPGHVVQIDESVIARSRGQRVRPFPLRWVFGAIDTTTHDAFLVEVPRRDAATLLPIIQQQVLPGTTVWSDQWQAYRQITQQTGLAHDTVNGSLQFAAPGTGVNTNAVKNFWKCAKDKFKRMHGTSQAHVSSYADEFLWHRKCGARDECFENAVALIRWRYPVPR